MTIANVSNKQIYTGDGTTTTFLFPSGFEFRANSDIKVFKKKAAESSLTLLTINTDYTITTASTTILVAPALNDKIIVLRQTEISQSADITNNGAFYQESIEAALDNAIMIIQDKNEEISRCLKLPISAESVFSKILPASLVTANKLLGVNSSGTAFEMKDIGAANFGPSGTGLLHKSGSDYVVSEINASSTVSVTKSLSSNPIGYSMEIVNNVVLPGTGGVTIPSGTTEQRPSSPSQGQTRFNTTTSKFEYYSGSSWVEFLSPTNATFVGTGALKLPQISGAAVSSPTAGTLIWDTDEDLNGRQGMAYHDGTQFRRMGLYTSFSHNHRYTPPNHLYQGQVDTATTAKTTLASGATLTEALNLPSGILRPAMIQIYTTKMDTSGDSSFEFEIVGSLTPYSGIMVKALTASGTNVGVRPSIFNYMIYPGTNIGVNPNFTFKNTGSSSIDLLGIRIEIYTLG